MVVTVLLNTLIALPVFARCRRVLRPVLAVDPLRSCAGAAGRRARPARLGLRGLELGAVS